MAVSRRLMLSTGLLAIGVGRGQANMPVPQQFSVPMPNLSGAAPPPPVTGSAVMPGLRPEQSSGSAPPPPDAIPDWRRYAITPPPQDGRPAITILIDDMGWMHPHTERAAALPGPLTLAWFPFSPRLPEQVAAAMARGHETMMHMPMQASTGPSIAQTGPDPLRVDIPAEVNLARLRAALAAVPMSVGLNNHMGTIATRDPALMDMVAAETRARGMLFLDSVVIPHSVALSRALAAGVPAAGRDVFIDWRNDPRTIANQFATIEAQARKHGHCIAIGHPRTHTLEGLEAWLPTLPGKGFALWPMSATIAWRNNLPMTPMHVG